MADSTKSEADERYLDALFDRILSAWTDGRDLSVAEMVVERPHLRAAIEELLAEAREVAVIAAPRWPEIPGYRILRELGRGGMGIVYLARQDDLGREVALKVLPWASLLSRLARQRLLTEARALGRIHHESIVTVHEVIASGDLHAYSMEWIPGRSLADALAHGGTLHPTECCRIGVQIARALSEVHRHGLVHRDVKPSNILLHENGQALLSDFGLVFDREETARDLTMSGSFIGTQAYAAPEQVRGERDLLGAATDIYALGASLFHALTGDSPFAKARSAPERLRAGEIGPSFRGAHSGIAIDLQTIVMTCMESDPAQRYASANALADDLERVLQLRPILARRPSVVDRAAKLLRRNRRVFAVALVSAGACLILAVVAGVLIWRAMGIPDRIAAHVHNARALLIEPTHEERTLLHLRGKAPGKAPRFHRNVSAALAEYDQAMALSADDAIGIQIEREVVAAAYALVEGLEVEISPVLQNQCPVTTAVIRAKSSGADATLPDDTIAEEDGRAAGLLGYLIGDVALTEAGWRRLDFGIGTDRDPFIEAASGQMLLAQGEHALALSRLRTGFDAYPDVGFLAVAIAECAIRLGDVDIAEDHLRVAQGLALPDPFNTLERVKADVLALRGRFEEAFEIYRWIRVRRRGESLRVRWVMMLHRRGRPEDLLLAARLGCVLVALEPQESSYRQQLAASVDAWFESSPLAAVIEQLERPLCSADPEENWVIQTASALERGVDDVRGKESANVVSRRSLSSILADPDSWTRGLLRWCRVDSTSTRSIPRVVKSILTRLCLALDRSASVTAASNRARYAQLFTGVLVASGNIASVVRRDTRPRRSWKRSSVECPPGPWTSSTFVPGLGVVAWKTHGTEVPGELWSLRDDEWRMLSAETPPCVGGGRLVFDPNRRRLLMVGYLLGDSSVRIWGWREGRWVECVPHGGSAPAIRGGFEVALDTDRDRLVLYGGRVPLEGRRRCLFDTWEWDGERWHEIPVKESPGGRVGHAMAYDGARKSVVLYGAMNWMESPGETWTFDGVQWTKCMPSTNPPSRASARLVYDPGHHTSVLFWGLNHRIPDQPWLTFGEVWEWNGRDWYPTSIVGPSPEPMWCWNVVYDEGRRCFVSIGGKRGDYHGPIMTETWMLSSR